MPIVSADCEICQRIARFKPDNPYLIAELETGYAVLGDNQFYPGYTIFIAKRCVPELHELPDGERSRFLDEMAVVAEAVFLAFAPCKLNYELLGNSVSHLHWHLFPRYADDPNPAWPVWNNDAFLQAQRHTPVDPTQLASMRERLQRALAQARISPSS